MGTTMLIAASSADTPNTLSMTEFIPNAARQITAW
jgi:hypothetical protein